MNIVKFIRGIFWRLLATRDSHVLSALSLSQPGPIALRAAADAETKEVLSVREQGNNSGKFVTTYLKSTGLGAGHPWCMAFVNYRLVVAARLLNLKIPLHFPRTASTVVAANWGKNKGLWIPRADIELGKNAPQRGDLVFFYFPAKARIAHTGIVVAVTKFGVYTVEGNTSSGNGVDREGQGVYKRFRTWKQLGLFGGFVRIPW